VNLWRMLTRKVQKVFWIYLSDIFFVYPENSLATVRPKVACDFVAITLENCAQVRDFRENERAAEFREKLIRGEKGFFAVNDGKMVGSIWATVNEGSVPLVARGFMRLIPGEALIHDIVTSANHRGFGIGPFMVVQISEILFRHWRIRRIIIDVNVKNISSLRMMNKAGLRAQQKALAISAFEKLVFHKVIANYV